MGEQLHDPEVYAKCILFSILTCFDSERHTFCISDSGVASVRLSYCFFDQSKPWTRILDRKRETLHWMQSSQEHVEFTLTILSLNPSSRTASRFCEISWSQFRFPDSVCSCLHSHRKKCTVGFHQSVCSLQTLHRSRLAVCEWYGWVRLLDFGRCHEPSMASMTDMTRVFQGNLLAS